MSNRTLGAHCQLSTRSSRWTAGLVWAKKSSQLPRIVCSRSSSGSPGPMGLQQHRKRVGRPSMTIQRMDNVLIVVEDLDAVISFLVELGMELEGKGPIEGP